MTHDQATQTPDAADRRRTLIVAASGRLLDQAAMGSGASNTARYLGGAADVALVVALAFERGQPTAARCSTAGTTPRSCPRASALQAR